MNKNKVIKWLNLQKRTNKIKVLKKNVYNLENWNFDSNEIKHKSGKFFQVIGINVITNFFKKNWDQPIIVQNENGILGVLRKKNKNVIRYLLQAKAEPGNINKIQVSPTVQATQSNYKRVHGGHKTKFLNYFTNKKFFMKSKQTEQGFRYLYKYNTNIVVNIKKNINIPKNYYWFSKTDLIYLIRKKNIINMDTISVFSCLISKKKIDQPLFKKAYIEKFYKKNTQISLIRQIKIPLVKLKDWKLKKDIIEHKNKDHFSVIGVDIKTNSREVKQWQQPIFRGKRLALAGFLTKQVNKTTHYLVRYIVKPGLLKGNFTCTVNTSDISNYKTNKNLPTIQKKILNDYFFNKKLKKNIIYDNIQSDEGGRFYHSQVRNIVLEVNKNEEVKIDKYHIWVSYNQMIDLIKKQKFDIEARLLFACSNFENII